MTREEEVLVAEKLLGMYSNLINKLKERDTTFTFTYEVAEDEVEDIVEDPLTAEFKLKVVNLVWSMGDANTVEEVLSDSEKIYKWVNK